MIFFYKKSTWLKLEKNQKYEIKDKTRIRLSNSIDEGVILDFQKKRELTKNQEEFINKIKDTQNCFFCAKPTVYFFPCGHRIVCETCWKNFTTVCPHCKCKIKDVFNPAIYFKEI